MNSSATRQAPLRPTPTWNGSPNDDAVQRLLCVLEFLAQCDARMPWGIPLEVSGVIRAELAVLQRAADRAIERAR